MSARPARFTSFTDLAAHLAASAVRDQLAQDRAANLEDVRRADQLRRSRALANVNPRRAGTGPRIAR